MRALHLTLLLMSGCATTLSTMQPADTLPAGGWHAGAGMNAIVPVTRVADALDAASQLEDRVAADPNHEPTDEERRDYLDAALGLALGAPGVTYDLMLRHGFADRFDAGIRWTTTGLHVDGKLQFLRHPSGWNGSISVGYVHHFFDGLLFDVLELIEIDDFSRWDIEVPVLFGRSIGDWGTVWGGPKYVFARYSLDAAIMDAGGVESSDGSIHYIGGFAGFAAGYRWVRVFTELTVMNMFAEPVILGEPTDIGGVIVVPSAGLMVRW